MSSQLPSSPKVVVIEPGYTDYGAERAVLAPFNAEVQAIDWDGDAAAITAAVADANAVLVRESPISAAVIDAMQDCKIIVRYGVGTDNIDVKAAQRRGIPVANVPTYGIDSVSDHAVALMLAVNRRIVTRDREVREGQWGIGQKQIVLPLRGTTLGLFGFGRIAHRAHEKFKAFGFARTMVVDPSLSAEEAEEADVVRTDFETLCRESDVISLHAPLIDATRHIFNEAAFALMKPTAILVNVGRGPLVDEAALVAALRENRIFGAGLDVFEQEPPGPDHPLMALNNAVLSDHAAWYSDASVAELQTKAAEQIALVFRGERPTAWVNRWED